MKKIISLVLSLVFIMATLVGCSISTEPQGNNANFTEYFCNVRMISLNTSIEVTNKDTNKVVGKISGNVLRFLTDPLQFKNGDELIGYASDRYDFLTQDDHAIVVNDEYQFTMKGNFHFIGDHYELLDELGNTIAKISFNYFNTKGDLYDMSGNLIASYRSNYFRKDYAVIIYDNDLFDDNALLMMFASYYSDRAADSD